MDTIRIGDRCPNFSYSSTHGDIILHHYLEDNWGIIFANPDSFNPIHLSEILEFVRLEEDLAQRHVKVCGFSCRDLEAQNLLFEDVKALVGKYPYFPIFEDPEGDLAAQFGLVKGKSKKKWNFSRTRAIFIVRPSKMIAAVLQYPLSVGANFHEVLRVIDSLQLTAFHQIQTPASWVRGQNVLIKKKKKYQRRKSATININEDAMREVELPSKMNYYITSPDPIENHSDLWMC